MDLLTVAVVVIALSALAVAVAAVPAAVQFRRTLEGVERFVESAGSDLGSLVSDDLGPMARSVGSAAGEVGEVARGVRDGVEKVDDALDAMQEVSGTVRSINRVLDRGVKGSAISMAAYAAGARAVIGALAGSLGRRKR